MGRTATGGGSWKIAAETGASIPLISPEGPEGDRVAELLRGRDRVLPGPACRAAEDVGRPGREVHRGDLAGPLHGPLETHPGGSAERDARHLGSEHGGVPVPSDARA